MWVKDMVAHMSLGPSRSSDAIGSGFELSRAQTAT